MRRVLVLVIGVALLVATPGLAAADITRSATNQKAVELVIARAMSQRGVPFAYGGGGASGPSKGTVAAPTPEEQQEDTVALGVTPGLALPPVTAAPPAVAPAPAPRIEVVGFDASGLMVYAYAGAGVKLPRSSGEQYKVGQKVLPSMALPGDLIFYGPEGTQSVALFIGNGQMVETTDKGVAVSAVRTNNMTPYLVRIIA
ncbi:NlpC/P60 family peptidoglycan-binding protein RipD [Mycobacterium sp. SMC-4]|uniref:NlpC/P60 family peptidoglycan-binding protein RipD n=1 Tax=Mycobacterium sp. SMC-4 TaxID=2857059 RepID=UPI0021B1B67F|nr:NlpC/P60 family peptidoglycan-binding protein RipD [Mycobacterium sp. SMC-4]UXA16041.1 NlpC/P60 family peptidoglycan-binding protein RipD [Mycobacterium sp. SMC-4]